MKNKKLTIKFLNANWPKKSKTVAIFKKTMITQAFFFSILNYSSICPIFNWSESIRVWKHGFPIKEELWNYPLRNEFTHGENWHQNLIKKTFSLHFDLLFSVWTAATEVGRTEPNISLSDGEDEPRVHPAVQALGLVRWAIGPIRIKSNPNIPTHDGWSIFCNNHYV